MKQITVKKIREMVKKLRKFGTPLSQIKEFFVMFDPKDKRKWISGFIKNDKTVVLYGHSK